MVAAPPFVTGLVGNADSVGRVTQPTQGVATCAATVSLLVVISRLPEALALTVSPVQVTVTRPAEMLCPAVLKVSLIWLATLMSCVVAIDDGTVTPQAADDPMVVTRLAVFGKVRRMKSDVALIVVAVVKEMVAVPAVVGLVGKADSVGATSAAVV